MIKTYKTRQKTSFRTIEVIKNENKKVEQEDKTSIHKQKSKVKNYARIKNVQVKR